MVLLSIHLVAVERKGMARLSGQVNGSAEFPSADPGHIVVITGGDGDTERSAYRIFANHIGSVSGGTLKRHINVAIGLIG